ncbi:MAG: hypothetical protein WBA46_00955 [Thermomicrobiales bacterium]
MKRLQYLWHQLTCLVSSKCDLFGGDDYTEWLEAQKRASERSTHQMRASRSQHGPIEDVLFPPGRKKGQP